MFGLTPTLLHRRGSLVRDTIRDGGGETGAGAISALL